MMNADELAKPRSGKEPGGCGSRSNLIQDSELFLTRLRKFKPQSLGCLEARRKSSSTLIFPSPQQACLGPPRCARYPHHVKPTPGYWIECHGSRAQSHAAQQSGLSEPLEAGPLEVSQPVGSAQGSLAPGAELQSREAKTGVEGTARSGQRRRPQLGKRTITRDDIDLHKDKTGSQFIAANMPPIKFQIHRYMSIEAATQQSGEGAERIYRGVGDGPPVTSSQRAFIIEAQDGLDSEENEDEMARSSVNETVSSCEPVDEPPRRVGVAAEAPLEELEQEAEFCCGLSRINFNKRSYHDISSGPRDFDQSRGTKLELISFEEENYEKHYYGREHWNYFTNDELLGPVILSLKQEVSNQRDHLHVLLRTVSYTLHGTIPASTICADRYDREAIVRELSEIAKLKPPLMLGQLPSTPEDLLKLDHIFIKTELKVGVIHILAGQEESEEAILCNREESELFNEFLELLGDRVKLKGFDHYKGGLDTVHNLTGTESVYTSWRNIEIMFHVSTMLPHEENDPQKLQKKRHIGNDIVCVAFVESDLDGQAFWPGCIKSYFLHTFIVVRTSPKPLREGERRKYFVSCVCRNEVQYAFRPYLIEQDEFYKSDYFREWLLVKIVNGERASYSAPKFARMQDRTRSQLLEDIITNLANHLITGQIPKAYRRGSWRPLGHARATSPLEDSMKDYFEDYEQLAKDFGSVFCSGASPIDRSALCDVVFKVKDAQGNPRLVHGVRAILAIRSRTFFEMLYGFVPPGATGLTQSQTSLHAIEIKALKGESSVPLGLKPAPLDTGDRAGQILTLGKRGSVGATISRKEQRDEERDRRQSMLPNLSRAHHYQSPKLNYLTVPGGGAAVMASTGSSGTTSTGGAIKNAFNRLVSGNWSGWSGNIKVGYKNSNEQAQIRLSDKGKVALDQGNLSLYKGIAKIDAGKLDRREFEIKEFDYETFQHTIDYIHNGQCTLSYETIPGLICAAEHYDLPDLLHACFHHANTHMRLSAVPIMMNALFQNSCFYTSAMQLLDSIYKYVEQHANEFLAQKNYLVLYESVFTSLLARKTLQVEEIEKFQAMHCWSQRQIAIKPTKPLSSSMRQKSIAANQEKSFNTTKLEIAFSNSAVGCNKQDQYSCSLVSENESEYRALMLRLNREINIKLDKIINEDLVKIVLPTKVFSNDKIFSVMSADSRIDY